MLPETELLINDPSEEFLEKVVRSVPCRVLEGDLIFAASSLTLPNTNDQIISYYEECRRRGIIPNTHLHYEYNKGFFRTKLFETGAFPPLRVSETPVEAELLFKGGRINFISFKLQDSHGGSGFKHLNETLLAELLRADYHFSMGDLTLAREYHPIAQLLFGKRSISLSCAEAINEGEEKDQRELLVWFNNLAQQNAGQLRLPTNHMFPY